MSAPLLEVRDLRVEFTTESGVLPAVSGVSFSLEKGETLVIVGESGSGKSVTSLAIMGLVPRPLGRIAGGEIRFRTRAGNVRDVVQASPKEMERLRGAEIAMIFQEPMTALNPVYTIGTQITETLRLHEKLGARAARASAIGMLDMLGIPDPARRYDAYPHELSGGMRQRAMIAMALSCNPDVLIADEPTTALDVTIQAQIIELIDRLKDEFNSAVILITHDLGVVADVADEIVVMYAGRVVEKAATRQLFYDPQHPYTWGLLGSIPRLDRPKQERLHSIKGSPPSLINAPAGCKFRPRCPHAFAKCIEEPRLENRVEEPGHLDRCWLSVEEKRRLREATLAGKEAAA
jgi:oligopeptide/dipeptide ABC transporter ATP-binding protein